MASSLKVWGTLLALLCLQRKLLVHSKDISRWKFMEEHHLDTSQAFSAYKCNVLMKKEALSRKLSRLFIYISWYKVKYICGRLNDRHRNAYIWALTPLKVLKCHWDSLKNSYTERRSYNYVQFHCNRDGYVDSIEDMNFVEPLFD